MGKRGCKIPSSVPSERLAFATVRRREVSLDEVPNFGDTEAPLRVLMLDGLTDASNVGTLLRIGVAFGVSAVVCSEDCCDPFHGKAIRASLGHVFHVPIVRGDLRCMVEKMRAKAVLPMAAVVQDAKFLDEVKEIPRRWALVLGSEHFGVVLSVREACDLVKVRMAPGVDSLNVAASAGVLLHGCCLRECS